MAGHGKRYGAKRRGPEHGNVDPIDIEEAIKAMQKMEHLQWQDLYAPGVVTELPYAGVGVPPARPGGAMFFVGMIDLKAVLEEYRDLVCRKLLIEGPRGIGKSCILRALAWVLLKQAAAHQKIVSIWDMEPALQDVVGTVKNALLFTYCKHESMVTEIQCLRSIADVVGFIRRRKAEGEAFYFIVDGAEYMDAEDLTGAPKENSSERRQLKEDVELLVKESVKCVYGISPRASIAATNKRRPTMATVRLQDGFSGAEYEAYTSQVSVLGDICRMAPHRQSLVDYYAGQHPLSLAVLDGCCRTRAVRKLKQQGGLDNVLDAVRTTLDKKEVVELIPDEEDWEAALGLFISSAEIEGIRESVRYLLERRGDRAVVTYSLDAMIRLDARYAVEVQGGDYCTPFIRRIYIEEFRASERVLTGAGAWEPYCRYLLGNPAGVNWAEMGWVCEHLIAEALITKGGLVLDTFHVEDVGSWGFSEVPEYADWTHKVDNGIFFFPLKYNYGAVDGVLLIRLQGVLHLFAIQVTVNADDHLHSVEEFMNLGVVERWIPNIIAEQKKWSLHFVFICCESKPAIVVPAQLKTLRDGGYFGTMGYTLHRVTFKSALAHSINSSLMFLLENIARRRTPTLGLAAPQKAATGSTPSPPSLLEKILNYSDRKKLDQIAKSEGIAPDATLKKAEFIKLLAQKLCDDEV